MKIVFIQPKSFFTWESLNIGYLSAYIKNQYNDVSIDFFTDFYDTENEIIDGCKDADIIGFSATSPQYNRALEIAKAVKTDNNILVLGGCHASNMTEADNTFDYIVKGEGERAICKIIEGYDRQFVWCDFIKNIDEIPFPDRECIKQKRNIDNVQRKFGKRIIAMLGNRGRPYNCVFCSSRSVWSKNIRSRSGANIFEEFDKITKDYKADFVTFSDDEMCVNKNQMIDFCELKIKAGNVVSWGCNAVCKDLNEDLLKLMKSAGCAELWMGVESGDKKILNFMRKPNTIDKVIEVFKLTKKLGFIRRAYCIIGMYEDDYRTIEKTDNLIEDIQPDVVGFTIAAPYPGCDLYKDEYKDIDWSKVDEYGNDITCTRYLDNDELKTIQRHLTDKYKNNSAYRNKA